MIAEMINRKVSWRGLAETLLLVVTVCQTVLCVSWHGAAMQAQQDVRDAVHRLAYAQGALAQQRAKHPGDFTNLTVNGKGNP